MSWADPALSRRHSSFLAWLLDPLAAHGLSDAFLRQFMLKAIGKGPPSTNDVTVLPEHQCGEDKFDIHVTGDDWCLVVENKVDDFPGSSQWARYQTYCDLWKKRGQQAWLVYITPHARRPAAWIRHWISYNDVCAILERLPPSDTAEQLIEDFCEHVSQI
jgi:hypothetical protein